LDFGFWVEVKVLILLIFAATETAKYSFQMSKPLLAIGAGFRDEVTSG
jgi:hypothetical protein